MHRVGDSEGRSLRNKEHKRERSPLKHSGAVAAVAAAGEIRPHSRDRPPEYRRCPVICSRRKISTKTKPSGRILDISDAILLARSPTSGLQAGLETMLRLPLPGATAASIIQEKRY